MTLKLDEFTFKEDHALWGSRRLWDLYQEVHITWSWHEELFDLVRSLNLFPVSSTFELSAIEFQEILDAPMRVELLG